MDAPVGKVKNARPVPVATIIDPVLPVPKLPPAVELVLVKLKEPRLILPAVSVTPVALETVILEPNDNVAPFLLSVIPENAKGLDVPNKLPVIEPLPPIAKGPVAVSVAAPNVIGPFRVRVLDPIAITPAVEV